MAASSPSHKRGIGGFLPMTVMLVFISDKEFSSHVAACSFPAARVDPAGCSSERARPHFHHWRQKVGSYTVRELMKTGFRVRAAVCSKERALELGEGSSAAGLRQKHESRLFEDMGRQPEIDASAARLCCSDSHRLQVRGGLGACGQWFHSHLRQLVLMAADSHQPGAVHQGR